MAKEPKEEEIFLHPINIIFLTLSHLISVGV